MAEMETLKPTALQSGKNNKRERVLAARQAPSLKKMAGFRRAPKQKRSYELYMLPKFSR